MDALTNWLLGAWDPYTQRANQIRSGVGLVRERGGGGTRTGMRKISKILIYRRDLVLTSRKAQGGAVGEVARRDVSPPGSAMTAIE